MFLKKYTLTVLTGYLVFITILATDSLPNTEEKQSSIKTDSQNQEYTEKDQQERRVVDDTNGEEIHNIQPKIEKGGEKVAEQEVRDEQLLAEKNPNVDAKKIQDGEQDTSVPQAGETRKESGDNVKMSDTEEEPSQSFFSFKNFVKNLVNPVLEELEKGENGVQSDVKVPADVKLNETVAVNITNSSVPLTAEVKNKTEKKSKFTCMGKNYTAENASVMIVNNTQLLSILSFDNNNTEGDCVLVLFFVPYCRFCADMAPSFNALVRVYPQLNVIAVDAAQFSNLNAKFGTVSVPNILLFHQSRAVVRFNSTEKSFSNLVSFVKNATGFEPNTTVTVMPEDFIGPLPSVATETTDYMLLVSWLFVIFCSGFMFVQSNLGQQWINRVKILWQEHQHID